MSLETIKQGIRKSIDLIKLDFEKEISVQKKENQTIFEQKYNDAYEKSKKLIEKTLQEEYIESLSAKKVQERNILLSKKKEFLDSVLSYVEKNLKELLGIERYKELLIGYIEKYASEGDIILVSPEDISILDGLNHKATVEKDNLVLAGVIIKKQSFDYNFSSTALIDEYYPDIENMLGKMIYE